MSTLDEGGMPRNSSQSTVDYPLFHGPANMSDRGLVGRTSLIRTSLTGRDECCGVTPRSLDCSAFVV